MPFVSPYVPQQPSPRIQELGQRVALLLAEFRQKYPDLSDEEVRQALALASDRSPDHRDARPAVAAVVVGAAVAAGLGAYLVGGRIPFLHGAAFPAVLAAAVAVLAAVVARRRRE